MPQIFLNLSPRLSASDAEWTVDGQEPFGTAWDMVDAALLREPDEKTLGEWEESDNIDEGPLRRVITRKTRTGVEVEERRDLIMYLRRPRRLIWHRVVCEGYPPAEVVNTRWEWGDRTTLVPDAMIQEPVAPLLRAYLTERVQASA